MAFLRILAVSFCVQMTSAMMPTGPQSTQQISGSVDMFVMDPNTANAALGGSETVVAPGDPSLTNIVPNGPAPQPAPAIVPTQLTDPSVPQPVYIDPVITDPIPQTKPGTTYTPNENLPGDPAQNAVTNLDPTAQAPIGVDGTAKPFTPTVAGQEPPPPSGTAPVGTGTEPASILPPYDPNPIQQGSAAPSLPADNSLLTQALSQGAPPPLPANDTAGPIPFTNPPVGTVTLPLEGTVAGGPASFMGGAPLPNEPPSPTGGAQYQYMPPPPTGGAPLLNEPSPPAGGAPYQYMPPPTMGGALLLNAPSSPTDGATVQNASSTPTGGAPIQYMSPPPTGGAPLLSAPSSSLLGAVSSPAGAMPNASSSTGGAPSASGPLPFATSSPFMAMAGSRPSSNPYSPNPYQRSPYQQSPFGSNPFQRPFSPWGQPSYNSFTSGGPLDQFSGSMNQMGQMNQYNPFNGYHQQQQQQQRQRQQQQSQMPLPLLFSLFGGGGAEGGLGTLLYLQAMGNGQQGQMPLPLMMSMMGGGGGEISPLMYMMGTQSSQMMQNPMMMSLLFGSLLG